MLALRNYEYLRHEMLSRPYALSSAVGFAFPVVRAPIAAHWNPLSEMDKAVNTTAVRIDIRRFDNFDEISNACFKI